MEHGESPDASDFGNVGGVEACVPYSGLRLDHQHVGAMRTPAVLLAASNEPLLEWIPRTTYERLKIIILDAHGMVVWRTQVEAGIGRVRVGTPLKPFGRFKCKFEDAYGRGAGFEFETGPFTLDDWTATWLEVPAGQTLSTYFSRADAKSARIYVTAQGLVRVSLNGTALNADRLDPSRTDISRALYRAYDPSELLIDGTNRLDFVLGRGDWHRVGIEPRLLAELVVHDPEGGTRRVIPSPSSTLTNSEIVDDQPFYVERHDSGAAGAEIDAARHVKTLVASSKPKDARVPPSVVLPDTGPPVQVLDELPTVEVARGQGWRTFDVGVNIAGRVRIQVSDLVPGTIVTAIHGEHIAGNGRVDTTNITMPYDRGRERQVIEWVIRDGGTQVLGAWFAYQGFRYVEVRGLPNGVCAQITGRTFHSDLRDQSELRTDAPVIGALLERARRTALNNLHSVPEDCPTREQSAWTGDTASAADYLFSAFDMASFAEKWIGDLQTSMQVDGNLPAIAPDVRFERTPPDPTWGSALHRMLHAHWLNVGDESLLRKTMPSLRSWAEYQLARIGSTGVISEFDLSYGHDWLALEQTPPPLIHTGAVLDCLDTLAWLEHELGDEEAAVAWVARAEDLRAAARRIFVDVSADPRRGVVIANGSQGALAVALDTGLLSADERPRAVAQLAARIRGNGTGVTTGFALTRTLVDTLGREGESQVIFDLLSKDNQPGIGAMIAQGPGTFWENWWIDSANTGTGSLDHIGLGAPFASWVWRHLAGVRPTGRGWTSFVVEPAFVIGVNHLALTHDTPRGTLRLTWHREGKEITVTVDVPEGSVGTLLLDRRHDQPEEVGPGHHIRVVNWPNTVRRSITAIEWSPPAIAPVAADVEGSTDLLASSDVIAGDGSSIDRLDQLICMPVPHAQTGRPVFLVRAEDATATPSTLIRLANPLDLVNISFVSALVDQCLDGRWTGLQMTLVLENGATRSSTAKAWPAGYSRIAVDTANMDPSRRLVAVKVGLQRVAPAVGSHEEAAPASFHLSELVGSPYRRTW